MEYLANVNVKSKTGITPLMAATDIGSIDIVQALLERNAEVNAKATNGLTALKIAEKGGSQKIVDLLRRAGAKE